MSPNTRPDYRATQRGRQCQRRSKVLHNSRRLPPRSVLESYLALSRRGTLRPISDFLRLLNRLQRSCGFELFDVDENDDLVPREIEVDGVVVELSNDNSEEDIEMTIKLSKKTYCAGWSCHENNNFRSVEAEENFTFEFRKVRLNWCVSFCQYHDGEKISKPITLD